MSDNTTTFEERFARLDARFDALERRFAVLEEMSDRILSLLTRIAGRQGIRVQF
jgi:hypothetical protein